jgi:hypothetical protein
MHLTVREQLNRRIPSGQISGLEFRPACCVANVSKTIMKLACRRSDSDVSYVDGRLVFARIVSRFRMIKMQIMIAMVCATGIKQSSHQRWTDFGQRRELQGDHSMSELFSVKSDGSTHSLTSIICQIVPIFGNNSFSYFL